jgi:hypothetical protein
MKAALLVDNRDWPVSSGNAAGPSNPSDVAVSTSSKLEGGVRFMQMRATGAAGCEPVFVEPPLRAVSSVDAHRAVSERDTAASRIAIVWRKRHLLPRQACPE